MFNNFFSKIFYCRSVKKIIFFSQCFIFLFLLVKTVWASGFGVSPAYFHSEIVRPGTIYSQQINILRAEAAEDLMAKIEINAPEIKSWISIDKGFSFRLPKDELSVPFIIKFKVPKNAALGKYSGQISVSAFSGQDEKSGIAVSLGAVIDFDLTVTNEMFSSFKIRQVKIPDFTMRNKPWSYKIFSQLFPPLRLILRIENTGNIKAAPSKIVLDIYGVPAKEVIESLTADKIKKIKPYQTEEIVVFLPSRLSAGQYWGKIKVYQADKVLYNDQIAFTVVKPGELLNDKTDKINNWHWFIIGAGGLFLFFVIWLAVKFRPWLYLVKLNFLKSKKIKNKFKVLWLEIKFKFWRWLQYKSKKSIKKTYLNKKRKLK